MTPEEERFKEEIEDLRARIGAAKKEKEEARDELIIRLGEHTDLLDKHVSLLHEEAHQLSDGIDSLNDKLDAILKRLDILAERTISHTFDEE